MALPVPINYVHPSSNWDKRFSDYAVVGILFSTNRNEVIEISLDNVVLATQQQVSVDLAGDCIILNLADGMYYGLNSTGVDVWRLIQQPTKVRSIRDYILEQYDVHVDQCEQDLLTLLRNLEAAQLLLVHDERC